MNSSGSMAAVLDDLRGMLGASGVLVGSDVSARFDGWPPTRPVQARCIARPGSTEQVARVLRYCNRLAISVVPHGGRTGLSGGAIASGSDLVLSLERLNKIEPVNPTDATVVVEAGVPLSIVQSQAEESGLFYPIDIGARGTATIGGTIATNAGGNRVLRYGMTREQVLGLEVVLADGTVVSSMNRLIKNNAGYDVKQLFIGSEGTLGVITRAVLRLRPMLRRTSTAIVGLSCFNKVLQALVRLKGSLADDLTSFEVMWPGFVPLILAHSQHRKPLDNDHDFYFLLEVAGKEPAQLLEDALAQLLDEGLIEDAAVAQNAKQAAEFWHIRDDATARAAAMKPNLHFDIGLPQSHMEHYVSELQQHLRSRWPSAKVLVFGHLADCNLHLNISVGADDEQTRRAVDQLVYPPLARLHGTITAEHGIGCFKRDHLSLARTQEEIALMKRLKAMMDPRGILNPGKVVYASSIEHH